MQILLGWLAAAALTPLPALSSTRSVVSNQRAGKLSLQNREEVVRSILRTAVSGATYSFNEGTGQPEWERLPISIAEVIAQQGAAQQHYGAQAQWRMDGNAGITGFHLFMGQYSLDKFQDEQPVYYPVPYTLRNGEEQVLSRWNMAVQKPTVSRVQAVVTVGSDGSATLESRGKGERVWILAPCSHVRSPSPAFARL